MSAFFHGKPALGWLRLVVPFALLAITALSCLLLSWNSNGRALGTIVMFHGFAFVMSLPLLMGGIVRFWYPDLQFSFHDGQPFAVGRFGRTLLLTIGLAIYLGCTIGPYVMLR